VKYLLAITIVLLVGCRAFQPTPKPQSGGRLLATIPAVEMPGAVQTAAVKPLPVLLDVRGPDNPAQQSQSVWERTNTDGGWTEKLTTTLAPVQPDHAREAWGSLERFKAQIKSYGSIRWAGIALIVVGCAGFVPQVRLIMGRSGQTAAFLSGFGLVFGAQMFQGNETLAMVLTFIGLGVWVVARKYGILQGAVLKAKGKI
jgi:hypothetical protein